MTELEPPAVPLLSQPTPVRLLQLVPFHKVMAGLASAGDPPVILMVTLVPVATKLYQTSSAGAGWFPPVAQPSKLVYGFGAVALILVPETEMDEPTPTGQADGVGKAPKACAVEQLSFAG